MRRKKDEAEKLLEKLKDSDKADVSEQASYYYIVWYKMPHSYELPEAVSKLCSYCGYVSEGSLPSLSKVKRLAKSFENKLDSLGGIIEKYAVYYPDSKYTLLLKDKLKILKDALQSYYLWAEKFINAKEIISYSVKPKFELSNNGEVFTGCCSKKKNSIMHQKIS